MEKGKIRIIGGRWRGKKILFPINPNLRPTPDRAKEAVFNWLGNDLTGISCLDLFAGTGAMGIEALSRGAIRIDFVETEKIFAQNLKKSLESLEGKINAKIHNKDFYEWFEQDSPEQIYDLIFIDPPFHKDLIESVFKCFKRKKIYSSDTIFYLESETSVNLNFLDEEFEIFREKIMKNKCYRLIKVKTT